MGAAYTLTGTPTNVPPPVQSPEKPDQAKPAAKP
jgi:hypothetical protein